MDLFLNILTTVTLPIFVLIVVGYVVQSLLGLSLETLNKLLINVVLPAFFIHFLATAKLDVATLLSTVQFTIGQFVLFVALGWLLARLFRLEPVTTAVVALTFGFANTGNFGVPVAQLAFGPQMVIHQVAILSTHSILVVIGVVALLGSREGETSSPLMALVRSPMIWSVGVGLAINLMRVPVPEPVLRPLGLLGGTYVPFALFTLGAALAGAYEKFEPVPLALMIVGKLVVCPALTWAIAYWLGYSGEMLSLLVVAAAAPIGVLLAIFTMQVGKKPRLAAAGVFLTTLLSPLTVTFWIALMRLVS